MPPADYYRPEYVHLLQRERTELTRALAQTADRLVHVATHIADGHPVDADVLTTLIQIAEDGWQRTYKKHPPIAQRFRDVVQILAPLWRQLQAESRPALFQDAGA